MYLPASCKRTEERMTSEGNEAAVGLTASFKTAPTSVISDNLERLPGAVGLRPFHHGGSMAGPAFTIRTAAGDNRAIHQALELFRPGDVLVVDGGGDTSRALIGEIIAQIAEHRGAAGFVIDGAIRDAGALARSSFPVFARAAIHRGPYFADHLDDAPPGHPGQVVAPRIRGGNSGILWQP